MISVELCPKCHASIALTSYAHSFEKDFARAYHNPVQYEVSCIESSLENPSADMEALVKEIARVESILDALKAHHAHLNRHIQRSTQFICSSSIRRLPTEVLSIIFASACTSFERSEYKTSLAISLVCSKWRDIALCTPSMWTHIYVAPYEGLDVYQHYIKRCGNVPISVKVDIPYKDRPTTDECDDDFPYEETYDYHIELVSDIYRHCAQWKVAELCMNQEDVNLLGPGSETPLLQSLTLVNDGPTHSAIPALFEEASSLTSFALLHRRGKSVGFECVANALPWRQFREVCTQGSVHKLSHLSDQFADGNNRTLILRPYLWDLDLPVVGFSLNISTLVLDSVIWTSSIIMFFERITIPSLQNLTMMAPHPNAARRQFYASEWTNPFSTLPKFLYRSGCPLQTFTVIMRGQFVDDIGETERFFDIGNTGEPMLEDSLVDALHSMKNLRALRVIEAELGPSLFSERLFLEMTEGHLLPELTSLELVWAEDRQPPDALIPMLCSRAGQGGVEMDTVSSVVLGVRNGGDLRRDVLECMATLRQHGIRATLW